MIGKMIRFIIRLGRRVSKFMNEHREEIGLIILGSIGAAVLVGAIVLLIGFGPGGPITATAAVAWQASIGNVTVGSLFAFLQSAAMDGPAAGILVAASAAVGAALGAAVGAFRKWWSR